MKTSTYIDHCSLEKSIESAKIELSFTALAAKVSIDRELRAFQDELESIRYCEDLERAVNELTSRLLYVPYRKRYDIRSKIMFEDLCGAILYKLYVDDLNDGYFFRRP